ncbi:hypothetical protein T12_12071 [Trichinella patagoniensis]|uniref:Uncharacterized protein n=1 Tax=Trichinella patagoniensis TaxID=990121 RepID=A0A0V0XXT0_9BILA|nr:hypothetical protein T12_12071 [Trichinella patagoniensis]
MLGITPPFAIVTSSCYPWQHFRPTPKPLQQGIQERRRDRPEHRRQLAQHTCQP